MLKFNRRNKRLVIPVGINPSYNINAAELYNVSDADVEANDVLEGKIAYGKDGKIVGTLDLENEKEESYQEGYEFGYNEGNNAGYLLGYDEGNEDGIAEQKAKLESITITENGSYNREDGWNSVIVDVPDLNGDYNEGVEDGIEIGKAEVIEGMNDATITAGTVFKGEIGYGKDGERIVGDYEFVEGFDFGVIGYNTEESNEVNRSISDDIAYSKQLLDDWNPNTTNASSYFRNDSSLIYAPLFDTSNVTNMNSMFYGCSKLTTVPDFDTSKVTDTAYMFAFDSMFSGAAPNFDLSSATYVRNMFMSCSKITSVPQYDLSNVVTLGPFLYGCSGLTSVPDFNTPKAKNYSETFNGCSNVVSIGLLDMSSATEVYNTFGSCGELENIAGVTNCGKGFIGTSLYHTLSFSSSSKLTKQSCLNIFNTIYDMTQTSVTDAKITLHSTTKALLSDEDIAIATSKGWTIA